MKNQIELSRRMQAAAELVSEGNCVCDVGCDHGYVSIYLVQSGVSPRVLAMDVNEGPLLRAKEHLLKYRVREYITLRLSDGLCGYLKGEADTLLMAGMGGRLMLRILDREPDKTADFKELILQPQSEIALVRKYLRQKGYILLKEDMILEEGKFYPLMKAVPGGAGAGREPDENKAAMEDLLGPLLLKQRHPVLFAYIEKEISAKEEILHTLESKGEGEKALKRKRELFKELLLLKQAKALWTEADSRERGKFA